MQIEIGAFVVASLLLASAVSFAADTSTLPPRQACAEDYKRLCPNVEPGGGRIAICMRENADKLSPQCRDSLQAARAGKPPK
jgi:hypothetical protein